MFQQKNRKCLSISYSQTLPKPILKEEFPVGTMTVPSYSGRLMEHEEDKNTGKARVLMHSMLLRDRHEENRPQRIKEIAVLLGHEARHWNLEKEGALKNKDRYLAEGIVIASELSRLEENELNERIEIFTNLKVAAQNRA